MPNRAQPVRIVTAVPRDRRITRFVSPIPSGALAVAELTPVSPVQRPSDAGYQPVSGYAVAAAVIAGIFALLLAAVLFEAMRSHRFALWWELLALPIAGAILAAIGRSQCAIPKALEPAHAWPRSPGGSASSAGWDSRPTSMRIRWLWKWSPVSSPIRCSATCKRATFNKPSRITWCLPRSAAVSRPTRPPTCSRRRTCPRAIRHSEITISFGSSPATDKACNLNESRSRRPDRNPPACSPRIFTESPARRESSKRRSRRWRRKRRRAASHYGEFPPSRCRALHR